jgi:periplasmic protein TonB
MTDRKINLKCMKTGFAFLFFLLSLNLLAQNDLTKSDSTSQQQNTVLTTVEVMPSFKGGEDKMYKWLGNNIKYPQVAKETGISGTVVISFIVEKDGTITNAEIIKAIGGGCDEEALRVIEAMPKWIPGKMKGVPVRVLFTLPIRFTLQ